MKAWAGGVLGASWRQSLIRGVLALVLLGALLWFLPIRRPGEQAAHHADHAPRLDAFEKAGVTELKEGQRGPGFRLRTFPGDGQVSLEAFRDKLVVLNFWATWCTPCTVEMPTLEALSQAYRERGLVVIGVSVDRGAPRGLLAPYLDHQRLTFPIVLDPDLATSRAWRVTSLPATFLVKPDGEVAGMAIGAREWNGAEMRALLETLLPAPR